LSFDRFNLDEKPAWKVVLRGAAIPGMIVGVCAIIGFFYALLNDGDTKGITKIGAAVGLFFSLWGGLEAMISIFFSSENKRTGSYLVLGYAIVWMICIYLILYGRP